MASRERRTVEGNEVMATVRSSNADADLVFGVRQQVADRVRAHVGLDRESNQSRVVVDLSAKSVSAAVMWSAAGDDVISRVVDPSPRDCHCARCHPQHDYRRRQGPDAQIQRPRVALCWTGSHARVDALMSRGH